MENKHPQAYIVSVDMGYGHQRAAYPLQHLAWKGQIIHVDNYEGIPDSDREIWIRSRKSYEFISRFKKVPVIGTWAFRLFDKFQEIKPFYPKRDLSRPSIQLWSTMNIIKKKKWGKHFVDMLEQHPLPLVTSFFVPAYMAETFNYSEDIYLIICDTDISRSWAADHPAKSRIKYCAPTKRVVERLREYGVPEENIFFTGFPLPHENIDGEGMKALKHDMAQRLRRLDPKLKYCKKYCDMLQRELGIDVVSIEPERHITITFAVGGAGAQRELGIALVKSLRAKILLGKARVNLVAGTHKFIADYFHRKLGELGLAKEVGRGINVVFQEDKYAYFKEFNHCLRKTDILWTKPSELSFYCALGLPIIMSDPIGSQEYFNRQWLLTIGAGINQQKVRYTDEWLFDWLESGWFAEAAMQGYFEATKMGSHNIEKVLMHHEAEVEEPKVVLQY